MGFFASKVGAGILAGTLTVGTMGTAGLLFTGSDTLDNATTFVQEAGAKITGYEASENSLIGKITNLRDDANNKISTANAEIDSLEVNVADLESQKTELEGTVETLQGTVSTLEAQIADLSAEVSGLQASLQAEQEAHASTQASLDTKTAEYEAKVAELSAKQAELEGVQAQLTSANETIVKLNHSINWAINKSKEADAIVVELEAQLDQANSEVQAHGDVVDTVKAETDASQPMTAEEIEAIDTSLEEVSPNE